MNVNWWAIAGKIALYFVMPLVGAVIGSLTVIMAPAFGYLSKDRELDIEMVRISLSILASEKQEEAEWGRRFALRALSKYSEVEIPADEFKAWAEKGTLPEVESSSAWGARNHWLSRCIEKPAVNIPDAPPRVICFDTYGIEKTDTDKNEVPPASGKSDRSH